MKEIIIRLCITALAVILPITPTLSESYRKCTDIESSGGSVAGQMYQCGECVAKLFNGEGCVRCGSVSLFIPKGEKILDKTRTASGVFMDWLDEINVEARPDGKVVSTSAKSWNEQGNKICLTVKTDG